MFSRLGLMLFATPAVALYAAISDRAGPVANLAETLLDWTLDCKDKVKDKVKDIAASSLNAIKEDVPDLGPQKLAGVFEALYDTPQKLERLMEKLVVSLDANKLDAMIEKLSGNKKAMIGLFATLDETTMDDMVNKLGTHGLSAIAESLETFRPEALGGTIAKLNADAVGEIFQTLKPAAWGDMAAKLAGTPGAVAKMLEAAQLAGTPGAAATMIESVKPEALLDMVMTKRLEALKGLKLSEADWGKIAEKLKGQDELPDWLIELPGVAAVLAPEPSQAELPEIKHNANSRKNKKKTGVESLRMGRAVLKNIIKQFY